jgi:hypothetical protein
MDPDALDALPSVLAERLDKVRALLTESRRVNAESGDYVGSAKQWALRHTKYRLEAEVAYLTDLVNTVSDIVADERNPGPRKPKAR